MFVLNFVTVSASNCNNALKAAKEILTYYTKYKFFESGAFTLCNPDDFIKINQGEIFKFEKVIFQ